VPILGHNVAVTSIGRTSGGCTAGVAVALCLLLSGCVSTVAGTAVRAQNAGPDSTDAPRLTESALDEMMLSIGELNGIVGATGMKITGTLDAMGDHSAAVSNQDCLGAIYGAEDNVYSNSGFTAVRDQVANEQDKHWVEQTAVIFPSATGAQKFLSGSQSQWESCAQTTVQTDDGDSSYGWDIDKVSADDNMITQVIAQQDSDGWTCQHALGLVSNLIVETWACGDSISHEAETMANDIIGKAGKK
jgi:hypothetical protein